MVSAMACSSLRGDGLGAEHMKEGCQWGALWREGGEVGSSCFYALPDTTHLLHLCCALPVSLT